MAISYKLKTLSGIRKPLSSIFSFKILLYFLLLLVVIVWLIPPLWIFLNSMKPEKDILHYPIQWFPSTVTFGHYFRVVTDFPISRWIKNSLIVAVATVLLTLAVDPPAAYALARLRFRGRNSALLLILATFLIPTEISIVPLFLFLNKFRMSDSYFSLVMPVAANAFNIFLFTQFFRTLPIELEEAAKIDGCSQFGIFIRIILPLSLPVIATVALFTFMASWNNFMWPLIVCNSDATRTLPPGLATFIVGSGNLGIIYGVIMAGASIAMLPGLAVFLLAQKHFVKGISLTGIKG